MTNPTTIVIDNTVTFSSTFKNNNNTPPGRESHVVTLEKDDIMTTTIGRKIVTVERRTTTSPPPILLSEDHTTGTDGTSTVITSDTKSSLDYPRQRKDGSSCCNDTTNRNNHTTTNPNTTTTANTNTKKRSRNNKKTSNVQLTNFTSLKSSHPYGVLPFGNRWMSMTGNSTTTSATSSSMIQLSDNLVHNIDECWQSIFQYLDNRDLLNARVSCKFFYVTTHQTELWRDLVLHTFESNKKANGTDDAIITQVGPTWFDTYYILFGSSKSTRNSANINNNKRNRLQYHKPIPVTGIYSDYYYRLHKCRAFAIPEQWYNTVDTTEVGDDECITIDRIRVEQMTSTKFVTEYENTNQPVVIIGGAASWKATEYWSDPQYLLDQTRNNNTTTDGNNNLHGIKNNYRATSGVAPLPANFTLESYIRYATGCNTTEQSMNDINDDSEKEQQQDDDDNELLLEEGPLYLFDRNALLRNTPLWKDYYPDLQNSCPYWDPERLQVELEPTADNDNNNTAFVGHDLFQLLGEVERPDHTWLIVGPQRSGSVFHIDPNCTHAWNATITGRKRWIFYPPGCTPPGVYPSADGDHVTVPLSIGEWIYQYWTDHEYNKRHGPIEHRPMECTTGPGDIVFVPHGWWHMVINIDVGLNIAITHNYVSYSNLHNVLRFLRTKQNQISGCRDRQNSIKPDQLYTIFCTKLQQICPRQYESALAVPDWTCKAWNSDTTSTEGTSTTAMCSSRYRTNCRLTNKTRDEALKNTKKRKTTHPQPDDDVSKSLSEAGHGTSIIEQAKISTTGESSAFCFSFL